MIQHHLVMIQHHLDSQLELVVSIDGYHLINNAC
jgi:hypothetical protein